MQESSPRESEPSSARSAGAPQRDARQDRGRRISRRHRAGRDSGPGFWAALLAAPLQLLLLALLGGGLYLGVILPELPDVEQLRDVHFKEPLQVYSADGALIGEFGIQRRQPVAYADIPPLVIQAFLATEDSRFFEHGGIDFNGLVRAVLNFAVTGEKSQGGSTISMQVVRNFFLTPEKSFRRKLTEALLTLHLEQALTKEEILELYLNQIFFGHRAYGISAAAALYYNKPLDALTLAEAAMLAGIPKAPSTLNPVTDPVRARERRDYILGRMRELGFITAEQYRAALASPDAARLHGTEIELDAGYVAEMARLEIIKHFGEEAVSRGYRVITTIESPLQQAAQQAVRKALHDYDERHGYRGAEARVSPETLTTDELESVLAERPEIPGLAAGLVLSTGAREAEIYLGQGERVRLGLDAVAWARPYRRLNVRGSRPHRVDQVLAAGDLIRLRREPGTQGRERWVLSQRPPVSGALVALAPRDGAVRALVGGYAFAESKFNRALDMRRQPGSSFKPFIHAAALHEGWTPASLVRDAALPLPQARGWNPKNADHKELGPIRLRKALALSRNLATINLLHSVGVANAQAYLERFGFGAEALPSGLSLALGTGELSPLKLAEGYAVFANGGYHVTPWFIQRIEDGEGRLLFEANPPRACDDCWYQRANAGAALTRGLRSAPLAEQVIDPRIAFQITSMLRSVIEQGTARRALELDRADIVGKTGTTNEMRDAWFAGFQAELVSVAWMGFDDFSSLGRGEFGGVGALGMWMEFMREALRNEPEAVLEAPAGMVRVRIDPDRGIETQAPTGMPEWIRVEYLQRLLGPEPVRMANSEPDTPTEPAPGSGTRLLDDLF